MRIIQAVIVAALLIPGIASATSLSDLSASMSVGEWKECTGCTNGLKIPGATGQPWTILDQQASYGQGAWDSILGWAHKGVWDPTTRKVFFEGAAHVARNVFISYDDATSKWSVLSNPTQEGHAYDHVSINVARREFHHRLEGTYRFKTYNISTGVWTETANIYDPYGYIPPAVAFQDFPDRDEVVMAAPGNGLWIRMLSNGTWTNKVLPPLSIGYPHNHSNYSPIHRVVVFGGGNGSSGVYKYDINGVLTRMTNAPGVFRSLPDLFTVDPTGGDFLLFLGGEQGIKKWYSFNPTGTGTWTDQGALPPIYDYGWNASQPLVGTIAIPINTYGVIMFLCHNKNTANDPRVWLYKRSSGPPPPPVDPPPASPSGVVVL